MASKEAKLEKEFAYVHLWVSADGESHIKECTMSDFSMKKFADKEQYVKSGPQPDKIAYTELPVGNFQPFHCCPQVQIVTVLSGKWFVKTTDGTRREMGVGEVLFQDNTKDTPAAKEGQHESGTVGNAPCHQFVVQLTRKPEVDNPGSL